MGATYREWEGRRQNIKPFIHKNNQQPINRITNITIHERQIKSKKAVNLV